MAPEPHARGVEPAYPLEELSWVITRNASVVTQYLAANELPQPSASSRGPSTVLPSTSPHHVHQARQNLIASSLELLQLAIGPSEFLPNLATGFQYIACLSWLCRYGVFHLVPLTNSISYANLATAAKVPEHRLKSIMRMAMTNMLFREEPDGTHVGHSATSALLARDDGVYAYATYMCDQSVPMAIGMVEAHSRWPDSTRPDETAYNAAFNTDLPFFEHISRNAGMMDRFAKYMRNVRSSEPVDLKHLVAGFSWEKIRQGGTVVDVGGSTGDAAIALATAFGHVNFVVQDLPANADRGRTNTAFTYPRAISSRVAFQGHDFTQPQPVRGADAYLHRMILHDWPDKAAVEILQHTADAMDPAMPESRMLIMDTVLPKPGTVPVSVERLVRVRDLTMMQAFNSKERDLGDWERLLGAVEPKLRLVGVVQPFGSAMSVLEVALDC